MKKEFICIVCPQSCRLTVSKVDDELKVEGYSCKRGIEYGKNEYTSPKRLLSTTVIIKGSNHPRLPIMSAEEIPKEKIEDCLAEIYTVEVNAPVTYGDIIIKNVAGTKVDFVASRSMNKKGSR